MKVTINELEYDIPASLAAITLQQRIDYENQYGKDLRKQLVKLLEIKNKDLQELESSIYHCELACKSLSFFAGIPLDFVQSSVDINDVLSVYHSVMKSYADDYDFTNAEFQLENEFGWNDDLWTIAGPVLNPDSKMTFGELITAKQAVQNLMQLGDEKWESLLPLCCIYFRKKGEAFNEDFLNEAGERYQLMKTLPLNYALHVAFFLIGSMSSWLTTFQSSRNPEDLQPAET
jgi:hypothetical protein